MESESGILNTLTPLVDLPAILIWLTFTRIIWPLSVTNIIWSLSCTTKQSTTLPFFSVVKMPVIPFPPLFDILYS